MNNLTDGRRRTLRYTKSSAGLQPGEPITSKTVINKKKNKNLVIQCTSVGNI